MGRWAADRLDVRTPEGSTFLFVPVSRPLDEILGEAAERGVLLAAGTTFGPYPSHVRVCYTSARPDVVKAGIERVRDILR